MSVHVAGASRALTELAERAGLEIRSASAHTAQWIESDPAFALDRGVPVICAGRWIADLHRDLRPDVPAFVVRPGVDTRPEVADRHDGPLRVHVIGDIDEDMEEPHVRVATSAEADVALDLTPSLLSFRPHAIVATLVPGRDEVIEHGVNGLLTEPDDPRGAARLLDLLARDRTLLRRLQEGAHDKPWPTLDEAAQHLREALAAIAAVPPAQPAPDGRPFLTATAPVAQTHPVVERPRLHRLRERLGG